MRQGADNDAARHRIAGLERRTDLRDGRQLAVGYDRCCVDIRADRDADVIGAAEVGGSEQAAGGVDGDGVAGRGDCGEINIAFGALQCQLIGGVERGCNARRSHDDIATGGDQYVVGRHGAAFDDRLDHVIVARLTDVDQVVCIERTQTDIALQTLCAQQAVVVGLANGSNCGVGRCVIDVRADRTGGDRAAETVDGICRHDNGEAVGVEIAGCDD